MANFDKTEMSMRPGRGLFCGGRLCGSQSGLALRLAVISFLGESGVWVQQERLNVPAGRECRRVQSPRRADMAGRSRLMRMQAMSSRFNRLTKTHAKSVRLTLRNR
jgi:hypothetical protein